jgi:hypothetical protein
MSLEIEELIAEETPKPRTPAPKKYELFRHIAVVEQGNAEVAELLADLLGWIDQEKAIAEAQGNSLRAEDIEKYRRNMKKTLTYLRLAIPPAHWNERLPAVLLKNIEE